MPVKINNSIRREIQAKLPNEDEVMEYFQAERKSGQAKEAYESYIGQKYGDDATDSLDDITDELGSSEIEDTELRSIYGSMKNNIAEGIPKILNKFERELNNRVEKNININSMSDIKDFCLKSGYNREAIMESLLSAVDQISSGRSKIVSGIKSVLKALSYGVLKTVQTVSTVFMLSFLAWPYLVSQWPVKGTAIIVSAVIGVLGPVKIAKKVDDRMFEGLI